MKMVQGMRIQLLGELQVYFVKFAAHFVQLKNFYRFCKSLKCTEFVESPVMYEGEALQQHPWLVHPDEVSSAVARLHSKSGRLVAKRASDGACPRCARSGLLPPIRPISPAAEGPEAHQACNGHPREGKHCSIRHPQLTCGTSGWLQQTPKIEHF